MANWWGAGTPAEMARRDYFVPTEADPLHPDTARIATLRALNPAIILLASSSAAELGYSATNDAAYNSERLAAIPTSWILTQVGSTLLTDLTASATSVPVADASKFRVDDLVVIDNERCVVTAVGNTLTVKRGFAGSGATAHTSGTRVAAAVSSWKNFVTLDMTADCPAGRASGAFATPGTGTEKARDWLARRTAGICSAANWDGVLIDVAVADYALCFRGSNSFRTIADRATPGNETDYVLFDRAWQSGIEGYLSAVRAHVGNHALILINGSPPVFETVNGTNIEGFPTATTTSAGWRRRVLGPLPGAFGAYLDWSALSRPPNLTTVMTYGDTADYRLMRFGLCTTLLGNGYFAYEESTHGHSFAGRWYDEYDNAGTRKGYLGFPTGAPRSAVPPLSTPDLLGGAGAFSNANAFGAWRLYWRDGHFAAAALDDGSAKIRVTQSAGALSGTQFLRYGVPVSAGTAYTISLRARSDVPKTIQAEVAQATAPYATYMGTGPIPVTTEWRTIEIPMTCSGTDPAAQLSIALGDSVGSVWLDDIKLRAGNRDVYRRDFEGGVALVNATDAAATVDLEGSYRKIKGTQDPRVNDGSFVTAVTLPPKDGIVLLSTTSGAPVVAKTPSLSPSRPRHGRYAAFTSYLTPAGAGAVSARVYLYQRKTKTVTRRIKGRNRRVRVKYWKPRGSVAMSKATSGSSVKLTAKSRLPYSGTWKAVVECTGASRYGGRTSRARTFTVR